MMSALASGFLLGLSAGLAPGPLLTLVVAQALRHGPREGCKVALAPLVTDAPIILLTLALAAQVAVREKMLGAFTLAGGLFVLYLAADAFRPQLADGPRADLRPQSWLKGVMVNMLSPHPWLFWMTVGAATLAKAMAVSWWAAVLFLGMFYLLLVGSKVLLALVAGRARDVLKGGPYRWITRGLGILLVVFALFLFREGWRHLAS